MNLVTVALLEAKVKPKRQADLQEARSGGYELALAASCERGIARCSGHTAGHRASASRALVIRDHPRSLLAFHPRGRSGGGAEGRRFTDWTQTDWTQMDPSCGNSENWKQANSMMGLSKENWSGREDLNLRPPGPEATKETLSH